MRNFAFALHNARHSLQLPGSCFKKDDWTPLPCGPLSPNLLVANQFQALLTSLSACFSTFAHATQYSIGFRLYLGLQVNDSCVHTTFSSDATLELGSPNALLPTRLSRFIAPPSRGLRLSTLVLNAGPNTTSVPMLPQAVRFALFHFRSRY